jgi:nucleoside-diphosphate-sugar epimerase
MRVLIVGGTRFIGPFLVRQLVKGGHEVTVFHRGQHEADLPAEVKHVHSNSSSYLVSEFPQELRKLQPDVVVHMVLMGEEDASTAVRFFRGCTERIVGISSGDVYRAYGILAGMEDGLPTPGLISEDAPLREKLYIARGMAKDERDWMYSYEKILAERAMLSDPELPGTILRLPAVYGPGDEQHRFLPWLKRMQDGQELLLLGEAQSKWRWTHGYAEDVAAAIALAATNESSAGKVYNLGEQVTPTVAERVERLGRTAGWTGKIKVIPDEDLPADLREPFNFHQDIAYETKRIREELGYRELVSEEEGLRRTVEWEAAERDGEGPVTQSNRAG